MHLFLTFPASPSLCSSVSLDLWKMATEYMLGKACIAEVSEPAVYAAAGCRAAARFTPGIVGSWKCSAALTPAGWCNASLCDVLSWHSPHCTLNCLPPAQCIKWDAPNRQTKIHLIPRPGSSADDQGEAAKC